MVTPPWAGGARGVPVPQGLGHVGGWVPGSDLLRSGTGIRLVMFSGAGRGVTGGRDTRNVARTFGKPDGFHRTFYFPLFLKCNF